MPYTLHFDVCAVDKERKLDILNSTESIKERKPAAYLFAGELPQEINEGFLGHVLNELIATLNKDYGAGFPLLGKCEKCGQWVDEIHLGHPQVPIYPEGELVNLREQDICVECLKKGGQCIATAALRKGWQFHAYGSGFSTPDGEIVCRSEREVFEAVGLPYQEPWERS